MKHLEKEKWIEDSLGSLDGIQRAQAPEGLFENAMRRAAFVPARTLRMPVTQVWSAAACMLLLLFANLFICLGYYRSDRGPANLKESFSKEYFGGSEAPQF
ncbi:MAG: hypothetical protein ACKVT2_11540 [Saprospiraceae bacterium]